MAGPKNDAERLKALKARIMKQESLLAAGRANPEEQRQYNAMKRELEVLVELMRAARKHGRVQSN